MENETLRDNKKHFSKLGLMYFFGSLTIIIVQTAAFLIAASVNPDLLSNADAYLYITLLPMYLIAVPIMGFLIRRVPAVKIEKHQMNLKQLSSCFCICYAIMYISNIIGQIITLIIGAVKGSPVSNVLTNITSGISPATALILMVLCAPVIEELLFRKLLIDRTVKYGEGTAILLSGLLFGLFHGNLNQFAYAFSLGIFWGFIYVKTGKLIYSIVLHMIINFLGSVVSLFLLQLPFLQADTTDMSAMMAAMTEHIGLLLLFLLYIVFIMVILITGIVLLVKKRRNFTCRPGEVEIPKGKRFSTVILNVGMILFILLWTIQIIAQLFM